ncbi:hypothetical protein PFLUV_G00158380 [Perca fluviatilis]|uniref:Uncharacterized protein n=1 Tax=Perca fluviatilis TaxID=8168 RepID=A0A6A5ETX1_PERFL|nr:hypothetical protein PFLUV_G00158380 [Perca fluviatilis]
MSPLRVCAWESPVGSGGGAQRDLTTRNLRENLAEQPSRASRCPQRTPGGWEAETGPPLTCVTTLHLCNQTVAQESTLLKVHSFPKMHL